MNSETATGMLRYRRMLCPGVILVTTLGGMMLPFDAPAVVSDDPQAVLDQARTLQHEDPEAALALLNASIREYTRRDSQEELLELLYLRASIFRNVGELDRALEDADRLRGIAQILDDGVMTAMALHIRGTVYHELGRSADAIESFHESRILLESSGVPARLARVTMALGVIFSDLGEHERAREYYMEALEIARLSGERYIEMYLLGNLGHVIQGLEGAVPSLAYHKEGLALGRELGDNSFSAYQLSSICDRYIELERFEDAEAACTEAIELSQRTGHARLLGFTELSLGRLLAVLGRDDAEVLARLEAGLELGTALGHFVLMIEARENLADFEAQRGNHRAALEHYREMLAVRELHEQEQRQRAIDELEVRYQTQERQQEIERLTLDSELQRALITRRTWMVLALLGVLILLGVLALVIWRGYRVKTGLERHLAERNKALQESVYTINKLASEDPLTGLHNRRSFDQMAAHELARRKRDGIPLTVCLADIDRFKQLNDTHGHHFGDSVLTAVSNRITSCLRDVDLVCRWGGEEFAILLPDADTTNAFHAMERIRQSLKTQPIETETGPVEITLTFGIAPVDDDVDTAIRAADLAMYEGKQAGRDRVMVHRDPA